MESEIKGSSRIYLVDVDSKEIKMLRIPGVTGIDLRKGDYTVLKVLKDTLIVTYTDLWTPPQAYSVRFKEIDSEGQTLDSLVSETNLEVNFLEKLDLLSQDDVFAQNYAAKVNGYNCDLLTLENGAEATFIRAGDLDKDKKHPMITLLHGGPFSSSPFHMFLPLRNFFLL